MKVLLLFNRRGRLCALGAGGAEARDPDALADSVLRVDTLLAAHPQIQEVDLKPVRVYRRDTLVLDARVAVGS